MYIVIGLKSNSYLSTDVCVCVYQRGVCIYLYTIIIYNIIIYGHNAYARGPITGQCIKAVVTRRRRDDVVRRVRQRKTTIFFFFFLFLRFLFLLIFPFQRRPRRINYNRSPVKSSLGELFIDPACPNGRAREHWTYIKI